jgi:hypothetical protein
MNKREQSKSILKEARKLAKTGDFTDWKLIEIELRDGEYTRARQFLDNGSIREELDKLCGLAHSEAEVKNRSHFDGWRDSVLGLSERIETSLGIRLMKVEGILAVIGDGFSVYIERKFNSDRLIGRVKIQGTAATVYTIDPPSDLDVHLSDLISDDESIKVIQTAIKKGEFYRNLSSSEDE